MIPLAWGGYDTAADVVARSFDFTKLRPAEVAYERASGAMIQSRSDGLGSRAAVGEADRLAHAREKCEKTSATHGTQPTPG